jgi:hypothetical protein
LQLSARLEIELGRERFCIQIRGKCAVEVRLPTTAPGVEIELDVDIRFFGDRVDLSVVNEQERRKLIVP